MIGVIDSNICNLFSLTNMLKKLKADYKIVREKKDFSNVTKLILPGVGSFPKAMKNLSEMKLLDEILDAARSNTPILGICLGMQLLFEKSFEFELTEGLGLIKGTVVKIKTDKVLPHMGWNSLIIKKDIKLLTGLSNGCDVYFVHSYRIDADERFIAATCEYGESIPAVVFKDNIFGTQFHPEKSQKWGEIILNNFINL